MCVCVCVCTILAKSLLSLRINYSVPKKSQKVNNQTVISTVTHHKRSSAMKSTI